MSEPGVSIITCTNNAEFFMNSLNNYRRQQYKNKELIIIINKNSISLKDWKKKVSMYPNVSVYKVDEHVSLGQCLNCGISKSKYPLIAKFDCDDYYSAFYLKEQVNALLRTGSKVVGKHACFVYLDQSKKLLVRSHLEMNKFAYFVQGGTILFRKSILKRVRFSNISLGEDVKFLKDCAEKGYAIYATTPYNYVYIRRRNKKTHTWKVNDQEFIRGGQFISTTNNFRQYAAKKI